MLATKVFMPVDRDGPNSRGPVPQGDHGRASTPACAGCGTDYVDLYQIHRWDPDVPIEETLEALHDVVKAGKARYLGASSMWAWQFSKALHVADAHGWTRFVTMQNHYNLLNREEEREMLPLCADEGIGVIPWSPLARGKLTRDWDETTTRSESDEFGRTLYAEGDKQIVDAVAAGRRRARRVARAGRAGLGAWPTRSSTPRSSARRRPHHLDDAVAAVDLELTADEIERLGAPYTPHEVVGFG